MPSPNPGAHHKFKVRPSELVVYQERNRRGRPTLYSREMAEKILDAIAQGELLIDVCQPDGMPVCRTVERWRTDDVDGFRQLYLDALKQGCDRLVELSLKLAHESVGLPPEGVAAYKLVIDSIRWRAARLYREVYGDKVEVTGTLTHRFEGLDHAQLVALAQKKATERGWLIIDATAEAADEG